MTIIPAETAFIFPGQGSQAVEMGKDLAQVYPEAREYFAKADEQLGFALSDLAWNGPEVDLNNTVNTQPALLVHSVATLAVLKSTFPDLQPAYVAGHSMGEISALVAAGALEFPEALALARRRGELMEAAGDETPGGMAAVLGLDIPTLEDICQKANTPEEIVQVANDNCPGQCVISGANPALERAMDLASKAGARRVVRLAVSIPAHSPLMGQAQAGFTEAVLDLPLQNPEIPIIGNVTASSLTDTNDIQQDLIAQLTSRVRWTESIENLIARGITTFVEIGSGDVLCGLVKRIDRKLTRISVGKPSDFAKLQ
jgi:[acyl-carrier-protein] S-malonyltransferase